MDEASSPPRVIVTDTTQDVLHVLQVTVAPPSHPIAYSDDTPYPRPLPSSPDRSQRLTAAAPRAPQPATPASVRGGGADVLPRHTHHSKKKGKRR